MRRFAVLGLLVVAACGGAGGHHECAWIERVILDAGWEERLTRTEKVQIAGHNENVLEFCR
jgi:hypothetical protein